MGNSNSKSPMVYQNNVLGTPNHRSYTPIVNSLYLFPLLSFPSHLFSPLIFPSKQHPPSSKVQVQKSKSKSPSLSVQKYKSKSPNPIIQVQKLKFKSPSPKVQVQNSKSKSPSPKVLVKKS